MSRESRRDAMRGKNRAFPRPRAWLCDGPRSSWCEWRLPRCQQANGPLGQRQFLRAGPDAMHLLADAEWQDHARNVAFPQSLGISDHQLRTHLAVVRRYADQVAISFAT